MRMANKAHFIPRQNGVTFTCLHTINMFFGQETSQLSMLPTLIRRIGSLILSNLSNVSLSNQKEIIEWNTIQTLLTSELFINFLKIELELITLSTKII